MRRKQRERERLRERWVGIGWRTRKLSLSWQQWKGPLVIEKKKKKSKAVRNSCTGTGQRNKPVPLSFVFFLSSSSSPTAVGVVIHSAIERRCTAASGSAGPLSARIWKGIGGDKAQILFYYAMWRVFAECPMPLVQEGRRSVSLSLRSTSERDRRGSLCDDALIICEITNTLHQDPHAQLMILHIWGHRQRAA